MAVEVFNESSVTFELEEFTSFADYVLEQMHVGSGVELSVMFIDPEPMEQLHLQWLDLPGPTDVMSFPMDELKPGTPNRPTSEGVLGDICICPQVAAQQAEDAGHSMIEEMLLLQVHGILHLLGYDHVEKADEEVMFALQRKLLLTFLAQK